MVDLQIRKAEAASQDLVARGFNTSAAHLDVTDSLEVSGFFDTIATEQGRVDILVNSAGLGQDVCSVLELSDQQWRRTIEVNLTGTFYTSPSAANAIIFGERWTRTATSWIFWSHATETGEPLSASSARF